MTNIIQEIDKYIEEIIKPWNAVGLTIGIIKDKNVILKKGYGIKDIETQEKVRPNTLFAIGSASKAFTVAAVAILIKQGKIKNWNDKIIKYLPYYKTSDTYAQHNMTIKDLLSMRSGYSSKGYDNMLFHGSHYTMNEIIEKSQYIPFDLEFRDRMRYDNLNFILAGKIIEEVSGLSWHEFIKKELFNKLNMSNTGSTYNFAMSTDVASPHLYFDNKVHKIAWRNIDNAAPAGSIISSIDDLLNWVRFQLSDGSYNGEIIVNEEDMVKMHTPHTVVDRELFGMDVFDDVMVPAYALGWFVYELNGIGCIGHGGNIDGFSSYIHLVPKHNLGIVILCNADHNNISQPIIRTITDKICGKSEKYNYNKVFLNSYIDNITKYMKSYKELVEKCNNHTINVASLEQYCGNYTHKIFGTQKIKIKNKKLTVERFDWIGELLHMKDDTFVAFWENDLTHGPLKFKFIKEDGKYQKVQVDMFGEFIREM